MEWLPILRHVRSQSPRRGSAVILAGGRGTRLGALTDAIPKPMLTIDGHPFIEYLVWQLSSFGIKTIVISCGYLGDIVRDYFGDGAGWGMEIRYSNEETPLGTGGAARLAASLVDDESFLLLNGDSVCEVDCRRLLETAGGDILGAMTLIRVPDGGRYGKVELDAEGLVAAFHQNGPSNGPALVNAGVYALRKELVDLIPASGPSSLERDVLPLLTGRIKGVIAEGFFIDMGLPETYEQLKRDPAPLLRVVRGPADLG
jgi:D-glycero-D-manno-heptose 1,7-bisphosphate phosphatase